MGNAAEKISEQYSLIDMFSQYDHFSKALLDAYALIDQSGKVVKCNQMFSMLVGKKSKQVLKANSIEELLTFEVQNKKLTIDELIANVSPTRVDEVQGNLPEGENLNLILGIYPFMQGTQNLGIFLLIRDVTAETNLQGKYKDKAHQSITDNLTGLYNRTFFDDYLPNQMSRMISFPPGSSQRDLTVMMMDIDHFKKCNDTYGHQAGDYVIAKVASIFLEVLRKTDIPCRYGGEEFLAILHATDIQGAKVAAEKIRERVQNYDFIFEGVKIPITISIGVAQAKISEETAAGVIARADAGLYFSKQNGRNKVSLSYIDGKME